MSNEGLCTKTGPLNLISYHLTRGSKYLFLQDLQWLYQNRSERHLTVFYINYSVWLCCLLRQYKYYLMRSWLFLLFQTYSVLSTCCIFRKLLKEFMSPSKMKYDEWRMKDCFIYILDSSNSSSITFWIVSSVLALEATEPVSEPVTQMAVELINNHLISVQQNRWV